MLLILTLLPVAAPTPVPEGVGSGFAPSGALRFNVGHASHRPVCAYRLLCRARHRRCRAPHGELRRRQEQRASDTTRAAGRRAPRSSPTRAAATATRWPPRARPEPLGRTSTSLQPNQERVEQQVKKGGNGMPSFADKLSPTQIEDVAGFVATAAGTGQAGKISFVPDDKKVEDCQRHGLLRAGVREPRLRRGPEGGAGQARSSSRPRTRSSRGGCHPIAHKIGAGGLLHYEGDVGKAFVAGNGTCGSGYYHGLLQWKLAGVKADEVAGVARRRATTPRSRRTRSTTTSATTASGTASCCTPRTTSRRRSTTATS